MPSKYLFDGLYSHPGQAINQSHPASGFVYPWIPNPQKKGGGVPQGNTFNHRGKKTNPLTDPFLPPPKLEILTPHQGGGVGTGGGGGAPGGIGGGNPGGGGGHMLK